MKQLIFLLILMIWQILGLSAFASSWDSFEDFWAKLSALGISPASLQSQKGLTRYQLTRLLNAVECQDCTLPTLQQTEHFNQDFWSTFSALPGKDFRDIAFRDAKHNNTNYYYCVAYVWEQNYMRGYPQSTSPLCSGNFCGSRLVSKGEFYQTLVNLLATRLAPSYTLPRKEIKNWLQTLSKSSYQYRTFDSKEIDLINTSTTNTAPAKSTQELHLYLKYCTFNPSQCGFRNFKEISTGVRPLAQMNLLIKEGIITEIDTSEIANPIRSQEALQMLYQVYNLHTHCDFNLDYDCDGIKNHQDNCPHTYNPSQTNMDGDELGDVCDPDIDGDGESNPIGLVDETGNVNYALLYSEPLQDKTPLWSKREDQYHFLIIDNISAQAPFNVRMHIQSKTPPTQIERDFWDSKTQITQTPRTTHSYQQGGLYTIRAKISEKNGSKTLISNQVSLPKNTSPLFLSLTSVSISGQQAKITADALWNFDRYEWSNSASKESKSSSQLSDFSPKLLAWSRNNITLKAYKGEKLVAFASTDIKTLDGKFINTYLQIPKKSYQIEEKLSPILKLNGLSLSKITGTHRAFGAEKRENKNLTQSHRFSSAGNHQIIQKTLLNNWDTLISTATIGISENDENWPTAINLYYLSLKDKNLWLRLQPLSWTNINTATLNFTPQENLTKTNISWGESIYYRVGHNGTLTIKSNFKTNSTTLTSQGLVSLSPTSLGEKEQIFDESKMYAGLKCDLDQAKVPDIHDIDIDGDGIPNLLGMINYEKSDCSLIPGENVNQNLYQQHFWVCALDNCPFIHNKDQSDLNNNGIWDACESATPKCWDGKIDQGETCVSCPEDVGTCTSICGNGIAEAGETHQNCPEDLPSNSCGNGKIEKNLNEECDNATMNGKDNKCSLSCRLIKQNLPLCGNGIIDSGETCQNCAQDVKRCFSLCGNGTIESFLGEECDDGPLNGKNNSCSKQCLSLNRCGNGKIDPGETCISCAQDVPTCDADKDKIPDAIDECPSIPEDYNGVQDNDGCPEPPSQCEGENCPLVLPNCNSCPCQYVDFSNTIHKNDQIRAQLRDPQSKSHYTYSSFAWLQNFLP